MAAVGCSQCVTLDLLWDKAWLQAWLRVILFVELFHCGKNFNTDTELESEQVSRSQSKSDKLWDSGKYSKGEKLTCVTWDK